MSDKNIIRVSCFAVVVFSLVGCLLTFSVIGAQSEKPDVILVPVNYSSPDQVVTLLNKSDEELNLSGFKLRDGKGNLFEFPAGPSSNVDPFGVLRVHSGPESQEDYSGKKDFHWTEKRVWTKNKVVQLFNVKGEMISRLELSGTGSVDRLAGCLTRRELTMYGLVTCPHCQSQKDKFGSSVKYINYVECTENRKRCIDAGISSVPAWVKGGQGKIAVGTKSLSRLSQLAGCNYQD